MKITAMAAVTLAWFGTTVGTRVGTTAGTTQAPERVLVYLNTNNVPPEVLTAAQGISSRMFATAGVAVEWRFTKPDRRATIPPAGSIVIEFQVNTPSESLPGAMAYARPYEGIHIVVLYDRIRTRGLQNPGDRPTILAHVLTHEIAHILQGLVRHSATGVMKASWDQGDFLDMTYRPLRFTPEDIALLRSGLRHREKVAAPDAM